MKVSPSKTYLLNLVDALFNIAQSLPSETIVKVLPWKFQPIKRHFQLINTTNWQGLIAKRTRVKPLFRAVFYAVCQIPPPTPTL